MICLPITALEMVIFNHILSRISRPESGSCITLTIVAMSLFTVKGDSSNSRSKKVTRFFEMNGLKRTSQFPTWMKHFKIQLHQQMQKHKGSQMHPYQWHKLQLLPGLQRLWIVRNDALLHGERWWPCLQHGYQPPLVFLRFGHQRNWGGLTLKKKASIIKIRLEVSLKNK